MADQLETTLPTLPDRIELSPGDFFDGYEPVGRASRHRNILITNFGITAGKAIYAAIQSGLFDGCGFASSDATLTPEDTGRQGRFYEDIFLQCARDWLPGRAAGYGGKYLSFPDDSLEPAGKSIVGLRYARNMRAIADALVSGATCEPTKAVGEKKTYIPDPDTAKAIKRIEKAVKAGEYDRSKIASLTGKTPGQISTIKSRWEGGQYVTKSGEKFA